MSKFLRLEQSKFIILISFLILTIIIYSIFYLSLEIPKELRNFYLVFAYPSDPLYLKILYSLGDLNNFPSGHNYLLHLTEILLYKVLGFEYIWLTAPIYKFICLSIIFLLFSYGLNLNLKQQILFALFIFALVFLNNTTFSDRFSRPHLVQFFVPLSYFLFFLSMRLKKYSNYTLFLSLVFLSLLTIADPWLVSYLLIFYSIYLFFKKLFYKNFLVLFSFLSTIFVIYLFRPESTDSFNNLIHLEYLGLKEIYNPVIFITDYFKSILLDKYILLSLIILGAISVINKNHYLFICICMTMILGWLPYLIIDISIQAYHVVLAAKSLLLYLIFFEIAKLFKRLDFNFSMNQFMYISLITFTLLINVDSYKSRIFERANSIYLNYNQPFTQITETDKNCKIISNDIYIRAFSLAFDESRLSVSDGFYNPISLDDISKQIKSSMNFLDSKDIFKDEIDYEKVQEKFLHYATHNYFSVSSSLIAPSLRKTMDSLEKSDLKSTFEPWNMVYPNNINFETDKDIDSALVVLKKDYNYLMSKPFTKNFCQE